LSSRVVAQEIVWTRIFGTNDACNRSISLC
jgi:hypothetical protein